MRLPGLAQPLGQTDQRGQAKLDWPDFSQGITPSMRLWEATDKAFAVSDAFMDAHVSPQDPLCLCRLVLWHTAAIGFLGWALRRIPKSPSDRSAYRLEDLRFPKAQGEARKNAKLRG